MSDSSIESSSAATDGPEGHVPLPPAHHAGTDTATRAEISHQNQLVQVRLGIASSLYTALRAKHAPTAFHSLRVAIGCSVWAIHRQLESDVLDDIEVAALLHDVGKIGVADEILLKPGPLTRHELQVMNQHRRVGRDILSACCCSNEIINIIELASAWYQSHGEGANEIPLGSRMLAIVDAFDAMTMDQVYRSAMSQERAIAELYSHAGVQFDPELVHDFAELHRREPSYMERLITRRWLCELQPKQSNRYWKLGTVADMSCRLDGVESLFHEELINQTLHGVAYVTATLQIERWNRGAERLTGIRANSIVAQRWEPTLLGLRDAEGRLVRESDCPIRQAISGRAQTLRRLTIRGRHGNEIPVNIHVVPVVGEEQVCHGAVLVMTDASSETTLEREVQTLQERATKDSLTRVANRAEFDRFLEMLVGEHQRGGPACSLIICDLDRFKRINDVYGHQAGDAALICFANLLMRSCRTGDLVARYGGEEFVMLCADCDNATATSRAEQLRIELMQIPQASLGGANITSSFGVTEIQAGDTPDTMLRRADRALLMAKESGRNRVVQLGSGIKFQDQGIAHSWWGWWNTSRPGSLLRRTLATDVPLNLATEKIIGFASDHRAKFISHDHHEIVLSIDACDVPLQRRISDRPVTLIVELHLSASNRPIGESRAPGPERTTVDVTIRPKRHRDRRQDGQERANRLLQSLRSYLIAEDVPPSTS